MKNSLRIYYVAAKQCTAVLTEIGRGRQPMEFRSANLNVPVHTSILRQHN